MTWEDLIKHREKAVEEAKNSKTITTQTSDLGLIIPKKTGVFFEHQTDGVMCNHPKVEGIFIPLFEPVLYPEKRNIMQEIASLNYLKYGSKNRTYQKKIKHLWDIAKKELDFEFEWIDEKDVPNQVNGISTKNILNQEALHWIKITKFGNTWRDDTEYRNLYPLLNKPVVLVYRNSD